MKVRNWPPPLSVPKLDTPEHAKGELRRILEHFGLNQGTYLGVDIPALKTPCSYVVTTYPAEWEAHYFDREYEKLDPAVVRGMNSMFAFDWREGIDTDQQILNFFGEAREYGLGRSGLSIPIRGAHGERSLFSISSDLRGREWEDFKAETLGPLTLTSYHFHQATLEMERQGAWSPPRLAAQEVEVLKWAAAGKSAHDTGLILSLSRRTVEFYLRNAMVKLGAVNKTQAVALAVRYEILR